MTNPSATLNLLNIRPSSVHRFPVHALISPDFQRFHRFFGDKFYILSIQTIVLCRHRLQTFFCLFVRIKLYLIAGGFCYLWIVKGKLRFVFILFILFRENIAAGTCLHKGVQNSTFEDLHPLGTRTISFPFFV